MLQILYQDDDLVAINKPPNLLVHRTKIDKHETRFAMQELRNQIGQYVYPVHRLDKPTSGVLLFALSSDIATRITALFESGRVQKKYLAVVRGVTDIRGVVDYALKEQLDKMTDEQAVQNKSAQAATTVYERIAQIELDIPVGPYSTSRYSLLQLMPETGRKHQIRRHMKHIFHPVIGDTTHGDGKHNSMFRSQFNCHRLLLHAYSLHFPHPVSEKSIYLNAKLDEIFAEIINRFHWSAALQFDETTLPTEKHC